MSAGNEGKDFRSRAGMPPCGSGFSSAFFLLLISPPLSSTLPKHTLRLNNQEDFSVAPTVKSPLCGDDISADMEGLRLLLMICISLNSSKDQSSWMLFSHHSAELLVFTWLFLLHPQISCILLPPYLLLLFDFILRYKAELFKRLYSFSFLSAQVYFWFYAISIASLKILNLLNLTFCHFFCFWCIVGV